jgi:hypothetical protein
LRGIATGQGVVVLVVLVLVLLAPSELLLLMIGLEIREWSGWPLGVASVMIGGDTVGKMASARWAGPSLRGRIAVAVHDSQMRRLSWR